MNSPDSPTLYLDLDLTSHSELFESLENLIAYLKEKGYQENGPRFFLFLDEIQRYHESTKILKNLYDHYPNIKIYASGSSTLEIKHKIKDSLAGRKFIYHIYSLDFEEFLTFKEKPQLIQTLKQQGFGCDEIKPYLEEFLVFGGYPAVALTANEHNKKAILDSIFDLFLKKDILEFLHLDNLSAIKKVLSLISASGGQLTNISQIAKEAGIDSRTLKNYLEILSETFLIFEFKPYFTNKYKEIVKSGKFYFYDTGARNYFFSNFNLAPNRQDMGFLFENMVIGEFIKSNQTMDSFRFWRKKTGEEIDLLRMRNNQILPIEIKYKQKIRTEDIKSLSVFLQEYGNNTSSNQGYLINLSTNQENHNGIILVNNLRIGT